MCYYVYEWNVDEVIFVHEAVTTNPITITLINLTVVFGVLILLSLMIRLIHFIDPTKPKKVKHEAAKPAAPVAETVKPTVADGINEETVAVIMAAIAAYGSGYRVHAIRPAVSTKWRDSGRIMMSDM